MVPQPRFPGMMPQPQMPGMMPQPQMPPRQMPGMMPPRFPGMMPQQQIPGMIPQQQKPSFVNLAISSPSEGGTSNVLTLSKINPMLSYSTRIDVIGDPLDPFEASEQATVEYRLEDGLLKRFQSAPSAGTTAERLLACEQMEVSLGANVPSILEIRLSFDRDRVVKQRSLKVAVNAL